MIKGDDSCLWLLGPAAAAALLRFAFKAAQAYHTAALGAQMERLIRADLLTCLCRGGPLCGVSSPSLPAVLSAGVDQTIPYFSHYLQAVRTAMVIPAVLFAAVLCASPMQALMLLVLSPLVPVFMLLIARGTAKINRRQWLTIRRLSLRFQEALQNLSLIRIFNLEQREYQKLKFCGRRWCTETIEVLKIAFLSALALDFLSTAGIAFCAVTLGFAIYDGGFDYGRALFVLLCVPEFFLPLRLLGKNYHARLNALGAASQMLELKNTPPLPRGGPLRPKLSACTIRLDQATVRYPDGRYGIRGLSLEIAPRKITVLSGPSGCGKTTILNALCCFVPLSSGEIYLGDQALRHCSRAWIRSRICYIPQNPRLFFGTLRNNLKCGREDLDDHQLEEALRHTGAAALLSRFRDGLSHHCGSGGTGGSGLSGGEVRLIALTRALLLDRPILLLDEPTSSLDHESEELVLRALKELARDRTVIISAHRSSLIALADRVIRLGNTGLPTKASVKEGATKKPAVKEGTAEKTSGKEVAAKAPEEAVQQKKPAFLVTGLEQDPKKEEQEEEQEKGLAAEKTAAQQEEAGR